MSDILQEQFLGTLVNESRAVTIFLVNGVKLQGTIKQFSEQGVLLEHKGHSQLVFRHAISTIMPVVNNTP